MNWFKRFSKAKVVCGIELGEGTINMVLRYKDETKVYAAASARVSSTASFSDDCLDAVQSFLRKHDVDRARCRVVLPSAAYQLLLVDRPEVPESELNAAVRWKIKDLISEALDSVVIDTFELPQTATKGKAVLYAVVADKALVSSIISGVKDAGLELERIDIEVLALRNLLDKCPDNAAVSVVRLGNENGDVSIFRGGNLFLTRHFKLNYSGGLLEDIPVDDLALEVQRSFDYFERQMGQIPPANLFLCGEGIGPEKVSTELNRSIAAKIELFDLASAVKSETDYDDGTLQLCVAALGVASDTDLA